MNRSLFLLVGAVAVMGCTSGGNRVTAQGGVRIAFVLPGGTEIVSLQYDVRSAGGAPLANATVDVSDLGANLSLNVGLPPGLGDVVNLTAGTRDNRLCTGASAAFDVVGGQTTPVAVTVTCAAQPGSAPGQATVHATVVEADNCPSVITATAGPAYTGVSGAVAVSATASDADVAEVLTYAWSPAGNFDHPTSPQATLNCTVPSPQTITLVVNDNHAGAPCSTSVTLPITCVVNPPPLPDDATCQPMVLAGSDTGRDSCTGGAVRRRAAIACPGAPIDPSFTCPPPANGRQAPADQCRGDGDCGTGGACLLVGDHRVCGTNICPV